MGWRDQLGETSFLIKGQSVKLVGGSYRGQPFHTVGAEIKVGRRNVVNEYPQRDEPYVDDLGRRARRFVLECYVIGENYLADRDALIDALEAKGSGELIHPRYGVRKVSVDGEASLKESPDRGGMARVTVTFVEDTSNTFPTSIGSTVVQLEAATNAADEATEAAFANSFNVAGASSLVDQALDGAKGLKVQVTGLVDLARRVTDVSGLSVIVELGARLSAGLSALIRTPAVLVQSLRSMYAQLVQDVVRPVSALAELQMVFGANARSSETALSGSTRARSLSNDTARADLQRRLSLSNQARLLAVALGSASQVATAEQAVALRNALLKQIDAELENNDPPADVVRALSALRAAVVRDVTVRAELLLQRATFTPRAVLPALLLAHRIYQDATRTDELVARNGISHPAFVPAAPLEVLR